jgi:hypothetical protein
MAAAINGKPPAVPSPTRLAFLPLPLFKLVHKPLRPLCLCNTPTRTREPQFPCAAASGFRRRRRSVAAGEGLDLPPVFFDFWDRQELDKLVLSQVFAPDARGRRAPSSPERRPSRRRRRAPLLPPPLRPLARRHPLCAVSIIPRPFSLLFTHSIASPSSPE